MEKGQCPNCLAATPRTPCASCGWQAPQDNSPPALALGRVLDNRYRLGRVLGHGGFGITYLAWDENLHLRLAIKEYLPRDAASRAPDGISVAVYSGPAGEQFRYGLDRFLDEARTLARFDQHPGIVTVKNFFRAHGTGYCVMEYVDGITLRDYLEQQPGGRISFDAALKLLMPVMDALRAVHKEGLLHRDIAPDNIYLTQDGRIKLLDFGAARFAAGEHSKSLSVILKPGYAPEEQYRTKGQQGPWTDVYGLAATLYRAITGQTPPEALDRLDHEELLAPTQLGVAMDAEQEAVLLKALAIKARERYQNMAELQQAWRPDLHPSPQPSPPIPLQDLQARIPAGQEVPAPPRMSLRNRINRRTLGEAGTPQAVQCDLHLTLAEEKAQLATEAGRGQALDGQLAGIGEREAQIAERMQALQGASVTYSSADRRHGTHRVLAGLLANTALLAVLALGTLWSMLHYQPATWPMPVLIAWLEGLIAETGLTTHAVVAAAMFIAIGLLLLTWLWLAVLVVGSWRRRAQAGRKA